MKRILTVTFFLAFFVNFGYSQDYKAKISSTFTSYYDLMTKGEIEKSMDYIYPKLFEIVPRDQMVKLFNQLLSSKEMTIKFGKSELKSIEKPIIVDGKHYVLFKYNSIMSMHLNTLDSLKGDDLDRTVGLMKLAFANKFGSENVKYEEGTKNFLISPEKKSVAISADGIDNWKFINIENEQKLLMEKLLPKEVRDVL